MNKNTLSQEVALKRLQEVHGDKYDYSEFIYNGSQNLSTIICKIHGHWKQKPAITIGRRCGCPKCGGFTDTVEFIKKSLKIHGHKYNYSKVIYKTDLKKVILICKQHGEFKQRPKDHLQKCGCPKCQESKGETNIRIFLEENNINYIQQFKFKDCVFKKQLPFDFYLPDFNICIEYDGKQHFEESSFFGKKSFDDTKRNDLIKTNYCKINSINLIRIRFDENIKTKLKEII